MPAPLSILVIADDPLAGAGLVFALSQHSEMTLTGPLDSASAWAESTAFQQATVMLWDLGWEPSADNLAQLNELTEDDPPTLVLIPASEYAQTVWQAGASGILPRESQANQLYAALLSIAEGLSVLHPDFNEAIFGGVTGGSASAPSLPEPLTPRELEVLHTLAQGLTNKAIAQQLDISEHTVKFHVNAILSKLGVQSRTEAVVAAIRLGVLTV
jgi:DNA-binding NarL/FixJ family response regulator